MTKQMERVVSVREGWTARSDSDHTEDPTTDNRVGLVRLAITVLLITGLARVFDVGGAVIVVTAILGMIMLHEFGHFITARWAGMKVTDFFVGFGPTLWSVKRGDTRYGVKGLPLGGFVRVIGMNNLEEVAPEDEPYTYRSKSYWQRVRFASAGSFMHFVIAFVLMFVLLAGFGVVRSSTTLESVTRNLPDGTPTPAFAAGIRGGDKLVGVNGEQVSSWEQAAGIIRGSLGKQIELEVLRDGRRRDFVVTPVDIRTEEEKVEGFEPRGVIGVTSKEQTVRKSVPSALWSAGFEVKNITVQSAQALFGLFTPESAKSYGQQLTKTGPADPETEGNRLLSPVGIFRIADASAESGVASVLFLLVAINIFVGIFNMVPLPPFDGGHVAVATYEAVRSKITRKRHMADMNKLLPVAYVVVVALSMLTLSALWLDIVHPFDLG